MGIVSWRIHTDMQPIVLFALHFMLRLHPTQDHIILICLIYRVYEQKNKLVFEA
jgi:hypothetical protein